MSKVYDFETGVITDDALVAEQVAEQAEEERIAHAYVTMAHTDGWKHLDAWLAQQVENCKSALLSAPDMEIVLRNQEMARACAAVRGEVARRVDLARRIAEEREDGSRSSK